MSCYGSPVARVKDPAVRTMLIERAAHLLRTREPITLRSLVAGTGVSTMAVYTYFGSMDGMWSALRQEGFTRLGSRLAAVPATGDPVEELTALLAAYVANAVDHPDLYRVMFDADFDLEDAAAADATLEYLVQAVLRAREAGRFSAEVVPLAAATRTWAVAHGVVSLVVNGPLPHTTLDDLAPLLEALFVSLGDEPERCRRSVDAGWQTVAPQAR